MMLLRCEQDGCEYAADQFAPMRECPSCRTVVHCVNHEVDITRCFVPGKPFGDVRLGAVLKVTNQPCGCVFFPAGIAVDDGGLTASPEVHAT